METIEIKNKEGEVLFTHAQENNTIRKTVEAAFRSQVNLRGVKLTRACMGAVSLSGADLTQADLSYSDLRSANFFNCYLTGADLRNTKLNLADLAYADLWGADLEGADLRGARLSHADLRGARMRGICLISANLEGANLEGADLEGADLGGANLEGARVRELDMPLLEKAVNLAKVQVVKPAHEKAPNKPPEDPPAQEKTELQSILSERASRYGDFKDNATLAQFLKNTIDTRSEVIIFHPEKRQALHAIIDKMARILTGDPDYPDNWIDIQGYAKLISDGLRKDEK